MLFAERDSRRRLANGLLPCRNRPPTGPRSGAGDGGPHSCCSKTKRNAIAGLLLLAALAILYLLPTLVAFSRNHQNVAPILIVNLFLGWSLIGWVVALSWSLTKQSTSD